MIGRYELHEAMSSGGMATVHFGRLVGPVGFSRVVAIKRLHPHFAKEPAFVSMFVDEARLVSRISHPNVIPTLDIVATDGELFLVMDYVHGESLSKLISAVRARSSKMSPHIVSAIMSGTLRGLHAAHEATHPKTGPLNIIHRDISPQNVFVGVDGSPRVLDFGVAKALDRLQDLTREGQLKGKLSYMAPEQFKTSQVTRSVDIFAASIVLWEALTARRLFVAERQTEVVRKIVEMNPAPPSGLMVDLETTIPRDLFYMLNELDRVVLKGLEKDPQKRFATAREMAEALERAVPPASPSEVTEWVELYAHDALAERSQMMSQLGSLGQTLPAPMAYAQIASTVEEARASMPSAPNLAPPARARPSAPSNPDVGRSSDGGARSSRSGKRRQKMPAVFVMFVIVTVAIILGSVSVISYTLITRR
ncbi:MAG: serine/threonine protein kinase [Polyangiaceae bacterium]